MLICVCHRLVRGAGKFYILLNTHWPISLLRRFCPGGCHQAKKQSPGHFTKWHSGYLWPGSTDFFKFGFIWKPWFSSFIVGMIASSALESECVAAWNVKVTFMKLPKFRKPENWPNCFGCHPLTSQSTASYHTHNERGDSGLSYEPKLWRIHWSGPEESAVSRSIKPGGATRWLFFGLMALPICLLVPGEKLTLGAYADFNLNPTVVHSHPAI